MRFYLPPHAWDAAQLNEAETHHAQRVLRLQPGAAITVFDGDGREASATIEAFHKKNASLRLGALQQTPRPPFEITLAQAIPKGRNMDLIIQKAVELGVTRIIPLVTDRTIVRCQDDETKQERWQAIALEACKQCGQNWMPLVEAPCSLQESLKKKQPNDLHLIASLEKEAVPIKNVFSSSKKNSSPPISSATIFIGPEGDFTPEEYLLARAAGCQAISLGPIVLRTETAALYCLSVLAYELLR
ncbi:MAG: 16S rRNA (uracil(1498)-N(3))-methyltransferase [Verrucomicrobiae bacterium]|nr:16S rRNA (uracil(1498)-N(3))-methyltransferase [Verrucomicrobiae bacterium]